MAGAGRGILLGSALRSLRRVRTAGKGRRETSSRAAWLSEWDFAWQRSGTLGGARRPLRAASSERYHFASGLALRCCARPNGCLKDVHGCGPFDAVDAIMERTAALSVGGSACQFFTTESRPEKASAEFCEAICEGLSEFPNEFALFRRFETSTAHHSTSLRQFDE